MTTLVLLPGLDGTGELFDPLVRELGPDLSIRVVRYPQDPGLGYKELLQFARDALPPTEPLVLLGESFSGPIAIQLSAERPDQVRGLICHWKHKRVEAARLCFFFGAEQLCFHPDYEIP